MARHGRTRLTRRLRTAGFTLVEVLVALAILAITLGAGLRAAGALVANAERQDQMMAAQWCAENQLVALRLARVFPGVGSSEVTCEQLGRRYPVQWRVQPTPNPNFRRVDVQVFDAQGQGLLTVSTIQPRF